MSNDRHPDLGPESFGPMTWFPPCNHCGENHQGLMCPRLIAGAQAEPEPLRYPLGSTLLAQPETPEQSRTRRIKELVREWRGRGLYSCSTTKVLIRDAAREIDAIDDAEVPPKKPSAISALESILGNEPDEPSVIGKLYPEYADAFRSTDDDAEVPVERVSK